VRSPIRVTKLPLPAQGSSPSNNRIQMGSLGCAKPRRRLISLYTADMSSGVSVDEFQALEQKVLRAVDLVKREREARAAAEAEVAALREQLAAQAKSVESQVQAVEREKAAAESQVAALNQERDTVRQRVERMLQQMDELL
jgi:predicted  nucleic acid-binding Zn-ribbon protein